MTRFRRKTVRAMVAYLTDTPVASTSEIARAFGFTRSTTLNYLRYHKDLFESSRTQSNRTLYWRLKR